uniref:Capsid scaffolding protein n=1 Tax=Porcine lymphotropic herpesvirus 2 TaxID=91741 RepID=Q8B418_9GAMA|nr:capsid protein [Porcine lymphotropic herpesvirus 2]
MVIFVAGFVDISEFPKSDPSLYLDETIWNNFLPIKNSIPLTIEHIDAAQIGWVLGLFFTKKGLFSVSVINSEEFISLLDTLYDKSEVAQQSCENLPSSPKLEILHSWLPELSLSSIHPDHLPNDNVNHEPFQHVSVCALGKRRGTVAVYGDTLSWVLSKFKSLTYDDINNITRQCQTISYPRITHFKINIEALLGKVIDACFINNRLKLLKMDRLTANIDHSTYLKASTSPDVLKSTSPNGCISDNTSQDLKTRKMALPPAEDLIHVPKSTFLSMLESSLTKTKQIPNQYDYPPGYGSNWPIFHSQNAMHFQHPQNHVIQPYPIPHIIPQYCADPQTTPLYYVPVNTSNGNLNSYDPYQKNPPKTSKRKRESMEDEAVFPGEESTLFKKDLISLSKTISEMHDELRQLRQTQQVQHTLPYYSKWPYYYNYPHWTQQLTVPQDTSVKDLSVVKPEEVHVTTETEVKPPEPSQNTVNASCKPQSIPPNTLQKLFCEELLNKQ